MTDSTDTPRRTVAVVDDDPTCSIMLARIFSRSGYGVVTFGSGEAFRTRSMPLRVEVVLRIDGVLRTLRSGEITREPEVVT